jgi:putative DNA primase/helicase
MSGMDDVRAAFDAATDVDEMPQDPRTPRPAAPQAPADPEEAIEAKCALLPQNDFGNGRRLTAYYGEDMIFVPRVAWFMWSGKLWQQDEDLLRVRGLAQKVAARITAEAEFIDLEDWERDQMELRPAARDTLRNLEAVPVKERTKEQRAEIQDLDRIIERADELKKKLASLRKSHHSHAKASGNSKPISNMMGEAQVEKHMPLTRMNTDKLMINTLTGVIRFVERPDRQAMAQADPAGPMPMCWEMEILPHEREQYLSKIMPVSFDANATCPAWLRFLEQIMPDQDLRDFLQRWFGYTLTGLTTEQKLAFFFGGGRNGKSTAVDLIAKMMGEYATTVPIETLTGADTRKGSDATPDLVRVPGARMVRASEPEQGQKMKEAEIKRLTGGEAILVRRMQQEFVEVEPEFKLTISGNHKPDVRGKDDGIWRRILLVPFDVQIAKEDVDPLLAAKLWAERSGILNWLLEGTRKWLTDGLQEPQSVIDATDQYRLESDPMLVFLNEECIVDGDDAKFTRGRDLRDAFNWWLAAQGEKTWGSRTIANDLKGKSKSYKSPTGHGFAPKKISDTGYAGVALKPEFVKRMENEELEAKYGSGPDGPGGQDW